MRLGFGELDIFTFHIPDTHFLVPSSTIFLLFATVVCVAVNVDVQPSSHICHMEIIASNWRWRGGGGGYILDLVDNKGVRFCSTL